MTDDKDIIARRIAGICKATPAACPAPQQKSRPGDRPAREQVFHLASVYTGRNAFVRCVVNDVSENGARLTLKTQQTLPEIVIVKFDQNGSRKRVRVAWQDGDKIGVVYCGDQTAIDEICAPGAPVRAVR